MLQPPLAVSISLSHRAFVGARCGRRMWQAAAARPHALPPHALLIRIRMRLYLLASVQLRHGIRGV